MWPVIYEQGADRCTHSVMDKMQPTVSVAVAGIVSVEASAAFSFTAEQTGKVK